MVMLDLAPQIGDTGTHVLKLRVVCVAGVVLRVVRVFWVSGILARAINNCLFLQSFIAHQKWYISLHL
jgi:hypothetical protein